MSLFTFLENVAMIIIFLTNLLLDVGYLFGFVLYCQMFSTCFYTFTGKNFFPLYFTVPYVLGNN